MRVRSLLFARPVVVALVVGLPASAFFLWLAVRGADAAAVRAALREAGPRPLAVAAALMGFVYLFQSERWRRLSRVGTLPTRRFVALVVSSVACNNVLPGRLGDILRARWLAREAGISSGRSLAIVVLDRASDLVALVLLLAVSLWTVSQEAWIRRVALGGLLVIALVAAVLLAARSYVGRRARDRHQRRGLLRRLARDLADGLAEPLGRRRAAVALCLSLLAWGCFAAAAVLVARSVGVRLGLLDALFVTGVMNLGVAIPSSPGFVGTYQWLGVSSLGLLGTGREEALAFSILLQASWYVPTTLVGAVLLATRALRGVRQRPRRDPFEI